MREMTRQDVAMERASSSAFASSARLAAKPSSITFAPSIETFKFVHLIRGSAATAASMDALMLAVEQPAN
ncbi:hypothetical protein [Rhizobium leguminosarum]|uniref:hypothetical protein n=1 Tax=Rhizobium leguminosarum TaxID=384 RepID=UPI0010128505|nr:hypothetical protein [Rhizobium leguminosarum]